MKRRTFLTTAGAGLAVAAIGPSYAQVPTLKVGSTPTGVPFTFLDTATNTIQGIMVDLITEIGKDAGFNVAVEPMQFSALIGALTSSRIDLISAAMFATAARKEVIDFSEPVYTYGEGLFVPKADTTNYTAIAELKGKVAGVQVGTAFVKPLQDSGVFSEVKIYDTIPDIMRDVNAGRVAAGFADFPIVAYNLQLGRFPRCSVGTQLQGHHSGIGRHRRAQVRQGTAGQDQCISGQAPGERHGQARARQVGPGITSAKAS